MIVAISVVSLLGAFLPQLDIFHSLWFLAIGMLLVVNIIVCTLNRWRNISATLVGGPVRQGESFYRGGDYRTEVTKVRLSHSTASDASQRVLRKRGYRVRVETGDGGTYLAADRNRHFKLSTYVSHFSLVLVVLGYVLGGYLGFRDQSFVVATGETREIGHGTGLSLKLVSFVDEYYPDNTPKDYRSDVVLYRNAQEAERAVVRVNHPLGYGGVTIYQAFFGPAVQLSISQNGTALFQGVVALADVNRTDNIPRGLGTLDLSTGLSVLVVSPPTFMDDPLIPKGQIAIQVSKNDQVVAMGLAEKGVPVSVGGLQFTYQADSRFSGFIIARDPALPIIWVGAALFILSVCLILYFPHRQVWILSQPQGQDSSRLLVRLTMPRGYNGNAELKALVNEIEKGFPQGM